MTGTHLAAGRGAWRWFLAWLLLGCGFMFQSLVASVSHLASMIGLAIFLFAVVLLQRQAFTLRRWGPWCGFPGVLGGVALGVCSFPWSVDGSHRPVVVLVWTLVGALLLADSIRRFLRRCESTTGATA